MERPKSRLDALGLKYGTDKASGGHDYLRWYEMMLWPLQERASYIFEMGVGDGGSLRMWRDYFPNASVFGMDTDVNKKHYEEDRITIMIGDQGNPVDLDLSCPVSVDVINDDAGHEPGKQMLAFRRLFLNLTPGGIYFLEDIGAEDVTRFFTGLAHHSVHADWEQSEDPWVRENGAAVASVSFYREAVAVGVKWHG